MSQKPFTSLENILFAGYSNKIKANIYNLTYKSSLLNKDNYNLIYKSSLSDNMDNYDLIYKSSPDKDTYSLTNESSLNKSAYDLTNESLDIENKTIRGLKDITENNSTSTSSYQLGKGSDNETIIKLTSMHLKHNHTLVSENAIFATQYWKLIVEMKDLIESYMLCNLDVLSQYAKDPDWYVQPLIDPKTNKLQDIILNDNMASTNTYNLPLSIFAMLLEQTIDATGVHSGAFIIDADSGLESIVPEIYPNTYFVHYTVENVPIELEYDFYQIQLNELFEGINHSLVAEVWKVQSIEHKSSVGKHINTMFIEPPEQTAAKVIGQKQLTKGTLLGLAYKCVKLVDYDDSNDFDSLMKMFKEWIYKYEEIQCNKEINMPPNTRHDEVLKYKQVTEDDQNLEQELIMEKDQFIERNQILENTQVYETTYLDVQNPLRHIEKERPTKKQIKLAIERNKKIKTT
ncbi:10912_t:CDS:2, partial [Cetraspora pellucida]